MKNFFCWSLGILAGLVSPAQSDDQERLIICGRERVFVIPAKGNLKAVHWEWRSEDSKEIPKGMRGSFATTDECKPYEGMILITSSSGGVALVERKNKKIHFFTKVRNAHSACLLPGGKVAVASSFGGDEVKIFGREKSGENIEPLMKVPLYGAHGVEWDSKRNWLWALGTKKLLKIRFEKGKAEVAEQYDLPTLGGHDLTWWDPNHLVMSVDEHCYLFSIPEKKFSPFLPLKDEKKVKSIDRNLKTDRVVWHKGTETTWWSGAIRFLSPEGVQNYENEKIYKVRWDRPRKVPGGEEAGIK